MSSMQPESVPLVPNAHPPATPHPTRAKLISTGPIYGIFDTDDDDDAATPHPIRSKLISTGPIYGIFDTEDDDDTATAHPGTTVASSMDCSTEGNSSHMGSPGPRPPLGVKRKADILEGSARTLKRPSWVNSPFMLKRVVE